MRAIHSFIIASLVLFPFSVFAGPIVHLSAQVSSKLPNDEMTVTLASVRKGQDVAELNEAVMAELNDAIKSAKAILGVKAQLGSVYTSQDWQSSRQVGWQVNGELVLTSQNFPTLATLAGKLGQKLQIRGVNFQLSETKRRAEETRLLSEAATAFRAKAGATAQAFGYQKYEIQELAVNPIELSSPRPIMAFKGAAMAPSSSAAPMPVEGGTSDVNVTIGGTVQMN